MKIKRLIVFLIIVFFLGVLSVYYPEITSHAVYEKEEITVENVLDGDTLKSAEKTIRLLCLNTPEKGKPYFNEAKDYLSRFENKTLEILRDKTDEDQYERKLRYVFYKEDLINEEILKRGLGHLYLCKNLEYEKDLKKAEKYALEKGLGIWKKSKSQCSNCIILKELNPEKEYFILENLCGIECSGEVKDEANHFINVKLDANQVKKFDSKGKIWNDEGDRFFLRDDEGLMLYYEY